MTSFSFKILFYLFRKGNIRQNNPLEHKKISTTGRSNKWPLDGAILLFLAIFRLGNE